MASNKHKADLAERHKRLMPCTDCELKELCKYAFIGKVELPLDVFEIEIKCKIYKPTFVCKLEG